MSKSFFLEGPSLIPTGATHALICLHGFGADGNDLLPAAQSIKSALGQVAASGGEGEPGTGFNAEDVALFSLHAPDAAPFGGGRQWFRDMGWTFRDAEGLARAAQLLEATLLSITEQTGIARGRMALLGFSQGSMTLLHALPLLSAAPAALISLCGGLTVEPVIKQGGGATVTPLLFIHGLADDVWPADITVHAEAFFAKNGYPTQLELIEGLGHGIDGTVLAHCTVFLAHTLALS